MFMVSACEAIRALEPQACIPGEAVAAARKVKRKGQAQSGKASWYCTRYDGTRTASGIPLRDDKLTAAHRSLPFGTKVLVRRKDTGASVVVMVTDRGPYVGGRIIDLSVAAARKLNLIGKGIAEVEITPQ